MNIKYAFAIIAMFVGIVTILFLYFRSILIVVNSFFIAGIVTVIVGAFIACKIPHFGIRRPALYVFYPNNPPLDNRGRSVKIGLLIIAAGVAMMLTSVMIWQFVPHTTF